MEILLATLNARYIHTAFGLRCLYANMGELQPRCAIMEFDIKQRPVDVAEELLANRPLIIGLGISIWNVVATTELVRLLKQLAPETKVVLGGPEVSHETSAQEIVRLADHVITGEADLAFAELCRCLLAGATPPKVLAAEAPDLSVLAAPYDFYQDEDIAHRVLYVEASRGCPFACEFCLSAVDQALRAFPVDRFLLEMDKLLARGARQFKLLDRTFNLDMRTSMRILQFFLDRWQAGMFVHCEMIPDRLPDGLRELIARFPPAALQIEVGIQTFNAEASANISRRQDIARTEDNLRYLKNHTGVHVHADLIAGLPGENLASFASGFDRLWRLGPQEIQVGILKRLRGAPIARHTKEYAMVYACQAPYELLSNRDLDFTTMQRLKRFARHWDMLGNSGRFPQTLPILLEHTRHSSPFWNFMDFSMRLHTRFGKQHEISPANLGEQLYLHLLAAGADAEVLEKAMMADHLTIGARGRPAYLVAAGKTPGTQAKQRPQDAGMHRRQQRHLDGGPR
jgi:hypothetical protein